MLESIGNLKIWQVHKQYIQNEKKGGKNRLKMMRQYKEKKQALHFFKVTLCQWTMSE